ncbi:replication factor C subunit 1 isoform X2 [Nilaparvata lugens]|nr:replication factor C subunit 1 isoform X2 [Nilaparvata lugens]
MIKEATGKSSSVSNGKMELDEKQKESKDWKEKGSDRNDKKDKNIDNEKHDGFSSRKNHIEKHEVSEKSHKEKHESSPTEKSHKDKHEITSSKKSHKQKPDSSPSRNGHKEKHSSSSSKNSHKIEKIVSNGLTKHKIKESNDKIADKMSNQVLNLSDSDSDDSVEIEKEKNKSKREEKKSSEHIKKEAKLKHSPDKNGMISPEKKIKKSPQVKKIEPMKNTCIDMSESGSSDEEIQIKSPQKRNAKPESTATSPKRRKIEETKVETGQKRKSDDIGSPHDSKKMKFGESSQSCSSQASLSSLSQASASQQSSASSRPPLSQLWVDKYRPASMKQLIGQQGDKSVAKKLTHWLSRWHANHSGNKKLQRPSPWAKDDDGAYFKAALLSGPPGIGKTTTAHLVCKELGFDMVEFNASDTRSKKLLHQEVSELLSSKSLAPFFTGGGSSRGVMTRNHVLVMDEVDGMAGNEDRGGIQELIALVKSAHVPIICMCNDRNHPKMRSLVNYCFDLRVQRPRVEQIKGAMMSICYKEGLKIAPDKLNDIIKSTDQDIRLILNHLSVLAANKDSQLPNSEKFVKLGPWDVLRKVFSEEDLKKMTFNEKSDLFFHDYSIAPLFVQENYLNVVPHAKLNKKEKMDVFAKAAESLCNGDLVDRTIRSRNAWSLLPVQAVFSSVVPGEVLKGHMGGQINFPAWLGKNSSKNKMDRLQQELLVHTRLRVSASKEAINMDYSTHLRDLIVRPLLEHGSEGVSQSLEALKNYDLVKDDLDSLTELCKWPSSKDPFAKVESKVKAAFTRAYNKSAAPPPYAVAAVAKKGRAGGGGDGDLLLATEDGLEEPNEAEAEDDDAEDKDSIEVDSMISVKKKTSKTQEKNEASSSKGRGAGGKRGRGRGK